MTKKFFRGVSTVIMEVVEIIKLVAIALMQFCITRFDNFGPSLVSIFNREKTRSEKHKILSYTIKNIIVFGTLGAIFKEILSLTGLMNLILNLIFLAVGISVFIYVEITTKEREPKQVLRNIMQCINIMFRTCFVVKGIMVIIALTSQIPIIGPIFWICFVLINLPQTIKEELKKIL